MALRRIARPTLVVVLALAGGLLLPTPPAAQTPAVSAESPYLERPASRDGTGRFYLGREIGRVMPHQAAPWLERSSRLYEELPDRVVAEMGLARDAAVADLGAGSGYFTFRLAERVPEGRVYAVDIQPEMLEIVRSRARGRGAENVVPVQGTETDPGLAPESVDAVLLVDAYHRVLAPVRDHDRSGPGAASWRTGLSHRVSGRGSAGPRSAGAQAHRGPGAPRDGGGRAGVARNTHIPAAPALHGVREALRRAARHPRTDEPP